MAIQVLQQFLLLKDLNASSTVFLFTGVDFNVLNSKFSFDLLPGKRAARRNNSQRKVCVCVCVCVVLLVGPDWNISAFDRLPWTLCTGFHILHCNVFLGCNYVLFLRILIVVLAEKINVSFILFTVYNISDLVSEGSGLRSLFPVCLSDRGHAWFPRKPQLPVRRHHRHWFRGGRQPRAGDTVRHPSPVTQDP